MFYTASILTRCMCFDSTAKGSSKYSTTLKITQ